MEISLWSIRSVFPNNWVWVLHFSHFIILNFLLDLDFCCCFRHGSCWNVGVRLCLI
jgi:hypothetical protein